MASKRLLIVTGAPATGKTTLAASLGSHFRLPVLSKDLVKEALLESAAPRSLEDSQRVGKAAFNVLFAVARELLDVGVSLVLEAPFRHGISEPDLKSLVDGAVAAVVVCTARPEVVLSRFRERAAGNDRHPGHMDRKRPEMMGALPFEPPALRLPTLIVDTSEGCNQSLPEVIDWITKSLEISQ